VSAPVWLLPSVGRPQAVQNVLDACTEMGMTQQGFLYADGDDYTGVRLPKNWMLIQRDENHGIGPAMNDIFAGFPFASHYGWLADDTVPRTPQFDELLTTAAGERARWWLSVQSRVRRGGRERRRAHVGARLGR
jgi:GT2 family glycosyltransferase